MQIVALASGNPAGGCFFHVYVQSWNGTTDAGTGLVRIAAWKTVYETGHGNQGGSVVVLGLAMLSQGFSLSGLLDGTAGSQVEETLRSAGPNMGAEPLPDRLPHHRIGGGHGGENRCSDCAEYLEAAVDTLISR